MLMMCNYNYQMILFVTECSDYALQYIYLRSSPLTPSRRLHKQAEIPRKGDINHSGTK